ncbi:MAG TPA: methyltransferase domain-containing protein [Roseiarcus sp.]|nr:methyltransferase domain-containing protein [Roseiarcus sp.]
MPAPAPPPALFDRALLAARLERACRAAPANPGADFLLRAAADELGDRLSLVRRVFAVAADVGSPGPHAAQTLAARSGGGTTLRLAPLLSAVGRGDYFGAVGDLERLPLADERCDLVVSLMALHHVNDLPGALIQIRRALRPDGLFLGALCGGDTLIELRQSLMIAESEILGGAAPRVAPFADVRALGSLMQRAGFALPVVDADSVVARYDDLFALMRDLRAFGATNALILRSRKPLRRAVLLRAASVYAERFADSDGRLRATFETIWLTGWAPHESQPKPLKPGSAAMRLADALNARKGDP